MALPKLQSSYKYELTLPVSGEKYKYRPYLVKEEKALLMANETGNQDDMAKAMMNILDSCFEGLNSSQLPMADMEVAFAHVRGRSAGENIDLNVPCDECGEKAQKNINLLDIYVDKAEDDLPSDFQIDTGDDTWTVKMRWPTFSSVTDAAGHDSEVETAFLVMASMLDTLLTKDDVYKFDDVPVGERVEFLDNLSGEQMRHIKAYMDAMPVAKIDIDFVCPHCQAENRKALKGLQNFFG